MIEEYAIVTERTGNQVTLELERRTACGICGQKRGCGNATWGRLLGHKRHTFNAENVINAHVGDSVIVGVDERALLSAVFFLYVLPLLGMLAGAVLADIFWDNEFYVIAAAVLGLVLGLWGAKSYLGGGDKLGKKYQAIILRRAADVYTLQA